jgi:streptomycin 6-kinase
MSEKEQLYMPSFEHTILNLYGRAGEQWLQHLPRTIHHFAQLWELHNLSALSNLSYNYLVQGMRGGQQVILKLSPDTAGLEREAQALKIFTGYGAATLLEEAEGAVLLQQARPGSTLSQSFPADDAAATRIICSLIKRLHQAPFPTAAFPALEERLAALDRQWPLPHYALKAARKLKNQLLAHTHQTVLLHGDLHHDNVLQHHNEWIVIDPKGFIGDADYEIATMLYNPLPQLLEHPEASTIIAARIALCAQELTSSIEKIAAWGYVQAMLAACWAIEDNGDPAYFLKSAECLLSYLPTYV